MIPRIIVGLVPAVLLAGCEATHLVYVHNASVGVDVTPMTDSGTARLSIGFDRETFALVPKTADATTEADAMSLFSASRIYIRSFEEIKFGHALATGAAAVDAATKPDTLTKIARAVFADSGAEDSAEAAVDNEGDGP